MSRRSRGIRRVLRAAAAGALLLGAASPARAIPVVLEVAVAQSSIGPSGGATQPISGTLTLEVGALPPGASNTSFDLTALALDASPGVGAIGLDPTSANPGLGVLAPSGHFLFPTLFLRITNGGTLDLAIPDVEGDVVFGAGGSQISSLTTQFEIDAGAAGLLSVTLVAVPEPATLALLTAGAAAAAMLRRCQEKA